MKKGILILFLISVMCASQVVVFATDNVALRAGISFYKNRNYVSCINKMREVINKDRSNVLAYYYLGMSYAQTGRTTDAKTAYEKVISLNTDEKLTKRASLGVACLEPGKEGKSNPLCRVNSKMDEDVNYLYKKNVFALPEPAKDIKQIELNVIKNTYGADVNNAVKYNKSDNSDLNPMVEKKNLVSDNTQAQPTDEEIANAVKTLARAGINPFQMQTTNLPFYGNQPYQQLYKQNPELMQLQMMSGQNRNSNGSDFMAMMPYLLAQYSQNNNNENRIDPELMKTMMMNSMMGSVGADMFSGQENGNY